MLTLSVLVSLLPALTFALPTPQLRPPSYKGAPSPRAKRSEPAPLYRRQEAPSSNGGYIVSLKPDSVDPLNRGPWLQNVLGETVSVATVEQGGDKRLGWPEDLFNGLSGSFTDEEIEILRDQDAVAWIQDDQTMYTSAIVQQLNAPWGIARLSSASAFTGGSPFDLAFPYTFDDSAGAGTTAYVIDTGVRTTHEDFGGRAEVLATFGNGTPGTDVNGHGTHVSGTIAGAVFGVAKQARIKAVKTMGDDGSGNTSDIISGVILAAQDAAEAGQPAVISMSIGGPANQAIDDVVARVVASGIPVIVAAGNEKQDAQNVSPARLTQVITVGSTDINDQLSDFSNTGPRVDILAPGSDILSCGVDADDAVATLSGTSMATPHISGLALLLMGQEGALNPADLKDRLVALGKDGQISAVPGNTINELASNGVA